MNNSNTNACIQASQGFFPAISLVLFSLLFSLSGNAQTHFVPGYIVLASHDTMRGFINDQEWQVNPKSIQFKKTQSGKETIYTPLTISSFRITNGNWYHAFVGPLERTPWQTNSLNDESKLDTSHDMLFVRALVVGHATLLYSFDNVHTDHYFIQKNGGDVTELYYKKYLRHTTQGDVVSTNDAFKGQLAAAFNDCPDITASLMSIPLTYSDKDLISIFQRYNKCGHSKTVYTETMAKWKFEPIILAGINYSSLNFNSVSPSFDAIVFDSKLGYAFGIALNSIIPRSRGKFSIYPELLVKNYNSTGTGPSNALFVTTEPIVMNLIYVKLNLMARFQKPDGNIRPFFQIGMSNGLAVKHDNYIQKSNGDHIDFLAFRTHELGLVGGVGARMKKIQLEGRLERSNGMSETSGLKTPFTTFYVLAAYNF